ncbi:hypothetical protein HN011_011123 [Eciton burchellii]|nr:hypothetical protein HN011_011123 [Eciton burchellii]
MVLRSSCSGKLHSLKYLLLWSGGCAVKRGEGALGGKNGNFFGTTTCSGNSHPFHRTRRILRDTPAWVRDKLADIEFTLATVNPSGAQFLGHGGADLAITVFRANKRAGWFVTRYRLPSPTSTIRRKRLLRD